MGGVWGWGWGWGEGVCGGEGRSRAGRCCQGWLAVDGEGILPGLAVRARTSRATGTSRRCRARCPCAPTGGRGCRQACGALPGPAAGGLQPRRLALRRAALQPAAGVRSLPAGVAVLGCGCGALQAEGSLPTAAYCLQAGSGAEPQPRLQLGTSLLCMLSQLGGRTSLAFRGGLSGRASWPGCRRLSCLPVDQQASLGCAYPQEAVKPQPSWRLRESQPKGPGGKQACNP